MIHASGCPASRPVKPCPDQVRQTDGVREHDITSGDGTRIRVWQSAGDGPVVLVCPGLATVPEAWPKPLMSGARLVSWYHRGTLGSGRPADARRVTLDDHVADALAVLDEAGADRVVVIGWSMGVMVAAELARRYPDRVSGLMFVAGTTGDMFGGLRIPEPVRQAAVTGAVRALRLAGPLVTSVSRHLPVPTTAALLLQHSGFMRPGASTAEVGALLRRFLRQDWTWYAGLALALRDVPMPDLAAVTCPITVLAARYDVVAGSESVLRGIGALPQARIRVLPTSHFIPLEAPEVVAAELGLLAERACGVRRALDGDEPVLTERSRHSA
jgi:pimeloyl-ACP methyl ester carboxylesterase